MQYARLWTGFLVVVVASFAVLGYFGVEIYQQAPPVPERVVTTDGRVLFTGQDIRDGQNVWQSMGGQEVGSVWGHGAYVAPDWSADWLHREAEWILNRWSQEEHGRPFEPARRGAGGGIEGQARRGAPHKHLRPGDRRPARLAPAGRRRSRRSATTTTRCSATARRRPQLRDAYAIPAGSVPDADRREKMNAFFFWAARGLARRTARARRSPTPTTGRPRSWSAIGRPGRSWSGR
jgi:nitric oxide reductase subunit B